MSKELHNGEYNISPYKRIYKDKRDIAKAFYSLLSAFHPNIPLTNGEVNLLAHISVYGGVASERSKKDYLAAYGGSIASMDNTIGKLKKKGMLAKIEGKVRINPKAKCPDFNSTDTFIFTFKCLMQTEKVNSL